jgi:hypothetical protein
LDSPVFQTESCFRRSDIEPKPPEQEQIPPDRLITDAQLVSQFVGCGPLWIGRQLFEQLPLADKGRTDATGDLVAAKAGRQGMFGHVSPLSSHCHIIVSHKHPPKSLRIAQDKFKKRKRLGSHPASF